MSTSSDNDSTTHVHLLIFPYPAQGHILPLLDFTHQLSLRDFTITILITPKNLPILSSLLKAHPTIQTLILPFPSHPSIPAGVENVKDIGNAGNFPVISALGKLSEPICHWFHAHPNPPVAIISDFFLGWTCHLADELKMKRVAFFSSSAYLASVSDYCWNHLDEINSSKDSFEFLPLPNSPRFMKEHLPSLFKMYKHSDPDSEFVKATIISNFSSWGMVFNSFEALEGEYLNYLKKETGNHRVFGVGPLSLEDPNSTIRVDPKSDKDNHAFKWLDGCPDGSVVYICFGSQKLLKREQMEALALALEKSETRFLWVVKTGNSRQIEEGYGSFPDGFEERMADRGYVVKGWAPQVPILSHRAVGGFLSHCGWNSVLEAVVGGVMVLAWPMEADQFLNAKLMVEDMGVGVWVCEGANTVPDSVELGRLIGESMSKSERVKVKAKELRDRAWGAVGSRGSSVRDLDKFVEELKGLARKMKF